MINNLFLIGIGGAAGSMLRYLCQRALNTVPFPYGTLTVNILGCFLIGILWSVLTKSASQESYRLLLMTGFCGGFTTFSAFTIESVHMLIDGRTIPFVLYITLSVAAGLTATFAGYKLFH